MPETFELADADEQCEIGTITMMNLPPDSPTEDEVRAMATMSCRVVGLLALNARGMTVDEFEKQVKINDTSNAVFPFTETVGNGLFLVTVHWMLSKRSSSNFYGFPPLAAW